MTFELIKNYYDKKQWTKHQVAMAVIGGYITPGQYEEITGEPYTI